MFGASADVISLLIKKYPSAANHYDQDGMAALHLACEADGGIELSVVEHMVEGYPEAASFRNKRDGSTPLHLAVANNATVPVLQALIKANRAPLSLTDDRGRLPLHVAVAVKASVRTFQFLVDEYPDGLSVKNKEDETPITFAQRMKLDEVVIKLLEPSSGTSN